MDSVVGSLTLAYYYSLKLQKQFIPVINCKRGFFPMKIDINMHLQEYKINPSDLIYMEDISIERVSEVALIDHNKLDSL